MVGTSRDGQLAWLRIVEEYWGRGEGKGEVYILVTEHFFPTEQRTYRQLT
jgi:hypothetical protein